MSDYRDLRELKRLLDLLRDAGNRQYKTQLRYVHDLLEKTPRFRAIFELLAAETTGFDAAKWIQEHVFSARQTCHEWPPAEVQRLCVLRRLMEEGATNQEVEPVAVGRLFEYGSDLDQHARAFTRHVVNPLVDYLQTRLGTQSEILYRLERMRRQIEWFEQESLYREFVGKTTKGEEVYDRRVREFLFAEGIDYPFSQASSPSGKADLVEGLDTEDPLVCEVKLYDGGGYGVTYLRQGVVQAIRYARDYGKASAHLVVFNLSDERLQLPSDEPVNTTLPHLQLEGVTLFMVVVQAKPLPSASKDRHRQVREVEREQLAPGAESGQRA